MTARLHILVQTPAHSQIAGPLTYLSEQPLEAGTLVRVPFGKRETLGVVWGDVTAGEATPNAALADDKLRPIAGVLEGIAPLCANWQQLVTFAARYYQRSLGEVALAALPPQLRDLDTAQLAQRLKSQAKKVAKAKAVEASSSELSSSETSPNGASPGQAPSPLALTDQQTEALAQFEANPGPFLLFGATGSGKTEVYLRCVARLLAADPSAQALVMVPEINLTPQLEARFRGRFAPLVGQEAVVALHSGMTPPQRLKAWLAAHTGVARIVLGTRLAVFASMPHLKLIVVDEEHDPSYKQTEGARYSARDLAVWRGRQDGAKVLLGSATPSLESWHQSRSKSEGGRYQRLEMPGRVGLAGAATATATATTPPVAIAVSSATSATFTNDSRSSVSAASPAASTSPSNSDASGAFARVVRVDMNHQPKKTVISAPLLRAIQERVARGEQSMLFLNRRGYAPVLACTACDWKSECPYCSAYRVFHKLDRSIRCHHCGFTEPVPRACPECGNVDLQTVGRGTERLEEHIAELLASVSVPAAKSTNTEAADETAHSLGHLNKLRILRIDADSTRLKGELEKQLARVHDGDVDVLVGTQMIAKGHDFRRITLVAAVNPDGALFSSDFRAPERLFALLMQAAGRAGRDSRISGQSEMWVQTFYPQHPLFDALKRHDYPEFARKQLQERQAAVLPPFSFQALVRADARTQEVAQGFLRAAAEEAQQPGSLHGALPEAAYVTIYPAVPMGIQRVANVERAQMLVESVSRADLQRFLAAWHGVLHATRQGPHGKGLIRWAVDVDPLLI